MGQTHEPSPACHYRKTKSRREVFGLTCGLLFDHYAFLLSCIDCEASNIICTPQCRGLLPIIQSFTEGASTLDFLQENQKPSLFVLLCLDHCFEDSEGIYYSNTRAHHENTRTESHNLNISFIGHIHILEERLRPFFTSVHFLLLRR